MSEKLTHGQSAGENGMNENRFNSDVDAAFDPEKRQAQQDWDNYLAGRNYKDGNGHIHGAEDGQFVSDLNDESEDDYYNRIHQEAESDVDARFANATLFEIADMIRDAKDNGDQTTADDAFNAFAEKFDAMSQRYGWSEDTINARMDRFTEIMNGENTNNDTAESGDKESEAAPVFEAGQRVTVRRTSGEIEDDWTVEEIGNGTVKVVKEDPEGNGILVKNIPVAELATIQTGAADTEDANDVEAAPVDSTYSEEDTPMFDEEGSVTPEAEPLASDELEILDESEDSADAEDLEVIDTDDDSEAVDSRSRRARIADGLRHPFAAAGAHAGAWAYTRRAERNGRLFSRRERIIAAMGGAAVMVAGAILTLKGHDVFSHTPRGGGGDIPPVDVPGPRGGGGGHPHPGVETITVHKGDGEIKVTQHILDKQGIHVNATDAERIGEKANVDLLVGDKNYDDANSTLNRIGAQPGRYKVRPGASEALLKAARSLGFRR